MLYYSILNLFLSFTLAFKTALLFLSNQLWYYIEALKTDFIKILLSTGESFAQLTISSSNFECEELSNVFVE